MKRFWLIFMMGMLSSPGAGQDLRERLREAADASWPQYISARNRIIALGTDIVPELEAVLADDRNDWRERAMAGIAIEQILIADRRDGVPLGYYERRERLLEEADLNYYFLEKAWKEPQSLIPRIGTSTISDKAYAEKLGNPFLIHVAREKIANIPVTNGMPRIDGNWFYRYLIRVRDRESLPHMFDLWLKYRPLNRERVLRNHREGNPHLSEEAIQRFADRDVDLRLRPLLEAAGPEDEAWIMEKLNGVPVGEHGRGHFENARQRWQGLEDEKSGFTVSQFEEMQKQQESMIRRHQKGGGFNELQLDGLQKALENIRRPRENQQGEESNLPDQNNSFGNNTAQDHTRKKIINGSQSIFISRPLGLSYSIKGVENSGVITALNRNNIGLEIQDLGKYEIDKELLHNLREDNRMFQFQAYKIGQGTLVLGASMGAGILQSAVYFVKVEAKKIGFPVTGSISGNALTMLVPGDSHIKHKLIVENKDSVYAVSLRKSEQDGPFEVVLRNGRKTMRPVPRPDNEETAELRGTVEVGGTMEVASRRLAEYEKGEMTHPPAESTWTHLWKVGDGMLAIEKDEDTDKIVKMGYIAWPEDENPVDLEISRIHLTDGEMVVPIPPPPPQDEDRQQAMQLLEELQRQEELRRQLQERRQQQANPEIAKENKERGDAFLAENADRDEVNVTESGLQYQVIETGKGEKPAVTDTVVVHYIGRLLDGTVFDSSRDRGDPTTFPLHQLIPGWTEGLQLMSPGAKYRFWMPSHLAYGQHAPPPIGPNQVLDFEVELIEVVETGLYLKP